MVIDLTTSTLLVIAVVAVAVLTVMAYRPVQGGLRRAAAHRESTAAVRATRSLRCAGIDLIDDLVLVA